MQTIICKFKSWAKPLGGDHNPRDTFNDPRAGGKRRHNGIDMRAAANTPIYAVMDGTVDAVGYHS